MNEHLQQRLGEAGSGLRPSRPDALIMLFLCALTALALGKDLTVGGLHDHDSAAHVMDGVLIHDWIAAGPDAIGSPMSFAREQYGHYPTLGIGRHYPPGFAIVEAAFFGVFGISAVTARLCVVFFGLVAACGVYWFVRGFADRTAATVSSAIMMTLPATTALGRQVMLEIPTLAVMIWAGVAFQWYLRRTTWLRLFVAIGVTLLAVAFKQPAVLLICAFAGALFFGAIRRTVPWSHACVALLVGFASLGGVLLVLDGASFKVLDGYSTINGYDPIGSRWGWASLSYYATLLPGEAGLVTVILAAIGLLVARRIAPEPRNYLLCWFGIAYLMLAVATMKYPRFLHVALLPVAVFAGVGAAACLPLVLRSRLVPVGASVMCLAFCATAMSRSIEHAPDYGLVVASHASEIEGEVILFSGWRDGDFVFAAREQLPPRSVTVLRGSKVFYTSVARRGLDFVPYVDSYDELIEKMRAFAFRYVFVEREDKVATKPDQWLRKYLAGGEDYELIASYPFPCEVEDSDRGDVTLDVYKLAKPLVRTVDHYDIPVPRTGDSIRVHFPKRVTIAESRG